jgi:acylphosphatase
MDEAEGQHPRPGWTSAHWLIAGRVQGVGFRFHVLQSARRLGIHGDVRNLRDGRVEVRARGPAESFDRFSTTVRSGPPGARVDSVETHELEEGLVFEGFTVR